MIEVVAGCLVSSDKKHVCVGLRPKSVLYSGWSYKWCFPGGKVENHETHEAALRREFYEETGTRIKVGELLTIRIFTVPFLYKVFTYRVEKAKNAVDPKPSKELTEITWISEKSLKMRKFLKGTKEVIVFVLSGI